MASIRIKNFGPIKEGYRGVDENGNPTEFMDIKEVTVFIGNQGSGKSTVAKLFSTLSWIEKAMVKGIMRHDELNVYNRFLKQLQYQRLTNYIQNGTEIEYRGEAFTFSFSGERFGASRSVSNGYLLPKIMYVPAERNFLSVVDRPDKLKNLPSPLFTFLDEYDRARNLFASGIELPINHVRFEYDKLNKLAHIVGVDSAYKLRLSEASSGFQSTVPLYLVSKFLSERLNSEEDVSVKENSIEEQRKLDKEIERIINDKELTDEVRDSYLRQVGAKRKPACFLNIVEEPEQNLFPESQQKVLYDLLRCANLTIGNKLIITTHSPYLVNYLSIAIQANYLLEKIASRKDRDSLVKRMESAVPEKSAIAGNCVVIYELNESTGVIEKLPSFEGIPSDNNYLNQSLRHGNAMFDSLLEIEQGL